MDVTDRGAENTDIASARVCVRNELGLHARPAARLAQAAQEYHSEIKIVLEDKEVDCKSILDILTLAVPQGCGLELRASGEDAREALNRLESLFKNKFEEAKG
jgi:phosphocarrier protein